LLHKVIERFIICVIQASERMRVSGSCQCSVGG